MALPLEVDPVIDPGSALVETRLHPQERRQRRQHLPWFSGTVLIVFVLAGLIGPWVVPYDPNAIDLANALKPPALFGGNWSHPLGTDDIGRDMYTRLLYGIRTSMFIGIAAAILATLIGTAVGAFAGLRGGKFDDFLMRVTDLFLAFPFLVLVILIREFLGGIGFLTPIIGDKSSIRFIIVLFAIFGWMYVARLVRGQVLALKEREFIEASRAVGASNFRIVKSHLLPNSIGPILVALTLTVIGSVVAESTLSFFGFGPQPGQDSTSLGNLIQLSRDAVGRGDWWLTVFPCGSLVLLAICINFIGDGLRDALDPKLDTGK